MKALFILLIILFLQEVNTRAQQSFRFNVNNINIPINNAGILADVNIQPEGGGGKYNNIPFLFSGGFLLSGYNDGELWANGSISSVMLRDYRPGIVGTAPDLPQNKIYVVSADDPPFGQSWQDWKKAVALGAEFYDGDGDGIYNPVDINENGTWDINEDMPLMLGDQTVWYVYNDGIPADQRRWSIEPKQIEVAQTIFASNKPGFEDVIFLRYKITNNSSDLYDSVYFSFYSDPDIGDHNDDLSGADTILNSGFVYNSGSDTWFGNAPPSFFKTLLQGPIVDSESISDTAYIKLGEQFDIKTLASKQNLGLASCQTFATVNIEVNGPGSPNALRNYVKGLTSSGYVLDPCTFFMGSVLGGVDCNEINHRFWYSGDPVSEHGWVQTTPFDIELMLNTGPFELKPNEPQELLFAFVIGQGNNAINSITVGRQNVSKMIDVYNNNFDALKYNAPPATNPVTAYTLYQNYPNPFNPNTTIKIEMPESGIISLKVFDTLGREVKTILNEFRNADRYNIEFDASGLASGVYFYRLQAGEFIQTKKMLLVK
jgi:hypothetical protein